MVVRINHRPRFGPVVGYACKASKSPELVASSLSASTPVKMTAEFEALAAHNSRCRNPCVHVVLSPAAGERLTRKQWQQLCERTAKELGAKQWVGCLHNDTAIQHCSLVLSRIGLDGKAWSTSNDRLRLRKVCMEFEAEHGLRATPERSNGIRVNQDEIEKAQRLHEEGRQWTPIPPRLAIGIAVRASFRQSASLTEFEDRLRRQKITTHWRYDEQGRPVGVSFGRGEASITGKNAGLSCRVLTLHYSAKGTQAHEQNRKINLPGRATRLDGALSRADNPVVADRLGDQHGRTEGDPKATGGPDRGSGRLFGESAPSFQEVGDLIYRATSRLALLCMEMDEDGGRFHREQIRMNPTAPHRFPSKPKTKKQGISP